jgi:hypothetical protein
VEKTYSERDVFELFVRRFGGIRTRHQVVGPDEFMTDDGDCWTAAWRYAQAIGATYVEGRCTLPPDPSLGPQSRLVQAHAWVEREGPFGLQVVELTRGYEQGQNYQGIAVNSNPAGRVAKATAPWVKERGSVIEAFFVSGLRPEEVLNAIA